MTEGVMSELTLFSMPLYSMVLAPAEVLGLKIGQSFSCSWLTGVKKGPLLGSESKNTDMALVAISTEK